MERKENKYKIILFTYSVFEIFAFSAPLFGWASMFYILDQDGYYRYLCKEDNDNNSRPHNVNVSGYEIKHRSHLQRRIIQSCPEQHRTLNGVFITVILATRTGAIFAGLLTDVFGPRTGRATAALMFTMASVSWLFLSKDQPWLIYFASILTAAGGYMSYFSLLQYSALAFDKYRATVIGIQCGASDSSAAVMGIFKALYDAKVKLSFQTCLAVYCLVTVAFLLLTTFTLIPSKEVYDKISESNSSAIMDNNEIFESSSSRLMDSNEISE